MKHQKTPASFIGQYAVQLDRCGSFRLPPAFRRQLLAESDGKRQLYFLRVEEVLSVYSVKGLSERMRQVAATQEHDIARFLWVQAAEGESSWRRSTSRVTVPPRLLEASGLAPGDRLALLGVKDHIEVWPEQAWEAELRLLEREGGFFHRPDGMLR